MKNYGKNYGRLKFIFWTTSEYAKFNKSPILPLNELDLYIHHPTSISMRSTFFPAAIPLNDQITFEILYTMQIKKNGCEKQTEEHRGSKLGNEVNF